MTPELLTRLIAALMYEYMHRAANAMAEAGYGPQAQGHYEQVLFPTWHQMMEELGLPLHAPADDYSVSAEIERLASYIRTHAQELAMKNELESNLPDALGPLN
jgi:hypothetical protein